MLEFIDEPPAGKSIGGVHCVPILDNGDVVTNMETAIDMIRSIEGRQERVDVVRKASELARKMRSSNESDSRGGCR